MTTRLTQRTGSLASPAPPHQFRVLGESVLVTNDAGEFERLERGEYERYAAGTLAPGEPARARLEARGFDRAKLDFAALAGRVRSRGLLDWKGPNVHVVVLTRRCNYRCLYCHASVVGESASGYDMTPETARRAVEFIFSTPAPELTIEFQGGEPLLNWPALKLVVRLAKREARRQGRRLHLGLISNFSLLDEAKLDWLLEERVSLCTSLDGPADLHDENRRWLGGAGHAETVRWLRRIQDLRAEGRRADPPNAVCTVTRASLGRAREIVGQALELGLERVQLGPLDPIGFAKRAWGKVGYEPEAFLAFYREALEAVLESNRAGRAIYEKTALILLVRILRGEHWRFPNGEGLCRLAYDQDGWIYSSEEGRLVAAEGDPFFRLGRLGETSYREVLDHSSVRALLLASHPWLQPLCSQCAYAPYCTVLPVYNRQTQDGVWGRMPSNGWCRVMMGLFDLLFEKLRDPDDKEILESWLEFRSR